MNNNVDFYSEKSVGFGLKSKNVAKVLKKEHKVNLWMNDMLLNHLDDSKISNTNDMSLYKMSTLMSN